MRAEHQYNFFHIYHDRCAVVTFQCKLFLLCKKVCHTEISSVFEIITFEIVTKNSPYYDENIVISSELLNLKNFC